MAPRVPLSKKRQSKAPSSRRRQTQSLSAKRLPRSQGSPSTISTVTSPPDFRGIANRTISRINEVSSPSTITADVDPVAAKLYAKEIAHENQVQVIRYLGKAIFPHLKFLDEGQFNLYYSENRSSMCQLIMSECFRNTQERSWWDASGQKMVRVAMSRLRSDKIQGIKRAFQGECIKTGFGCV